MSSATPQTDRIERAEVARLATEFRAVADRWQRVADAHLVTGRVTLCVRYRARAWVYAHTAQWCHEQLQHEEAQ